MRSELATVAVVRPATVLAGELRVPGDKSIAHRALMLAAVAEGESRISGLPDGEDVRATIACLRSLGVRLSPSPSGGGFKISPSPSGGASGWGFTTPHGLLDCANSGTTIRLLLGLLAGSRVWATLDGDGSLRRRPMARVFEPLRLMGARIESENGHPPISVRGTRLQGRHHSLPVASAQVKSAILLAGLAASGPTTVVEPVPTRDHTERLLQTMGADIRRRDTMIELRPSHRSLAPIAMTIPGDFSSAAFWMAAAALRPDWSITIRGVGLNPTRIAFAALLRRMGADIQVVIDADAAEPVGALRVVGRPLTAINLGAAEVATAIDEIPALLAVATQAEGVTTIDGAGELRIKESDRIAAMAQGLRDMGAVVVERPDGISIQGPARLHGVGVDSRGDHRIAMALAIAGLVASGPTAIRNADSVSVSYPEFFQHMREVVDVA